MADEKEKVGGEDIAAYYSTAVPELTINLDSETTVQAADGVLKLNAAQDEKMQKLLKTGRPDITQNIRKLDMSQAEQIARDYQARQRPLAAQGMHNTLSAVEAGTNRGPIPESTIALDVAVTNEGAANTAQEAEINAASKTPSLAERMRAQTAGKTAVETVDTQNTKTAENLSK